MKNRKRAAALILAAFTVVSITGCGQRVEETEKQTETEAVTEVVIITEAPQTEKQTEAPTEAVTEAVTEAPVVDEADLPADDELAAAADYEEYKTMYANDDVNVRNTPSTESSDSIYSSYDQGQEATVTGETPHWFRVEKDGSTGYVHKNGLSASPVEEKTPEERAAEAAGSEETAPAEAAAVSSDADTSFSESFTVVVASDANLRAAGSETADVLNVIAGGTTVVALGETGDWYQVDYNGTIGYVNKNLVE